MGHVLAIQNIFHDHEKLVLLFCAALTLNQEVTTVNLIKENIIVAFQPKRLPIYFVS